MSSGHRELMGAAIERDAAAQRALLRGQESAAREAFAEAAELYRQSWERASPTSYGRLIGMLKSAVLAGEGAEQASYAQAALTDDRSDSPAAAYVRALASAILADERGAREWSAVMRSGSEPFARTADAIDALAAGDAASYAAALGRIVHDFEQRSEHLTGVAIADTALMLQRLAARRAIAAELTSPVLPAV